MRHALSLLLCLVVSSSGCGGDDGVPDATVGIDATAVDARSLEVDAPGQDAPSLAGDAPRTDDDAPSPPIDASSEPDAVVLATDAGTDAASALMPDASSSASLGPVQCSPGSPCPRGAEFCNQTAPGGVCGCGLESDCPAGTACDTDFGVCVRDCATASECSAGATCSGGSCRVRRCSPGSPCPDPYVCSSPSSGLCQRPSCAGGAMCPAPMRCESAVCVEP